VRQDQTHSLWDAARSPLLLLVKPIALSSLLGVTRFLPLHGEPLALDASGGAHAALTDMPVDARDTREEPFQSQLDCCFPADFLHVEKCLFKIHVIRLASRAVIHRKDEGEKFRQIGCLKRSYCVVRSSFAVTEGV
jgi:hypothetical protein